MKYGMKNLTIVAKKEFEFKIEAIEVEYNVQELKQFAENGKLILDTLKSLIGEVAPVISMEIEKKQKLEHSFCMERIEAEQAAEKEKQDNWRERHANV